MTTNVSLTPDLERFARQCVDDGGYNNVSEVVRSALRLLQEAEGRKKAFLAMLVETREEAERDGWVSAGDALAAMDAVIVDAERGFGKD